MTSTITGDDVDCTPPAHDAIAAAITSAVGWLPLVFDHDRPAAEGRIRGLFDALHAVDSLRYEVRDATCDGARSRGYQVWDTWTDTPIEWCAGRVQADRMASSQNALNADEAAAELATTLDTFVGA